MATRLGDSKLARLVAEDKQRAQWHQFHKEFPGFQLYKKPYRTPSELVSSLQKNGLIIQPNGIAERIIYSHNYFRLKAYFIPFYDSNDCFSDATHFSEIYGLYLADQSTRELLFCIIAKLEIRLRSVLDNVITSLTNAAAGGQGGPMKDRASGQWVRGPPQRRR